MTSSSQTTVLFGVIAGLLGVVSGCGENRVVTAAIDAPSAVDATQPANVKKGVPDEFAHRPSPIPDRIILTWTGDPSRSQAVTWRTDATVTTGLAEIAVAGDNNEFAKRARQLKAKTQALKSDLSTAHYHSVEFHALSPKTKYAYRVGDGGNWSEWFHFSTASDQPDPFSFIYFGDAQNDLKPMWSRVIREAFKEAPSARFLLHAGDLINDPNKDAHWGEWFQAGGWMNGMVPSVPTPGNHEYHKVGMMKTLTLTSHWKPQFTLPENGPEGLEETCYYLDFQGTRIISLNSNEETAKQCDWMEKVLTENPGRWSVITFHHPIYSSAKTRDNVVLRALWQPIFDKHKVDLVLQGHDHTYARSGLVGYNGLLTDTKNALKTGLKSAGEAVQPAKQATLEPVKNQPSGVTGRSPGGTVYVVSVSGPKMYDLGKPVRDEFQRVAEDTQLFQVITVDGDELRYVARTATGVPYDGFTLRKRSQQLNELIEQVPDIPQRLRPPKPEKTTSDGTKAAASK